MKTNIVFFFFSPPPSKNNKAGSRHEVHARPHPGAAPGADGAGQPTGHHHRGDSGRDHRGAGGEHHLLLQAVQEDPRAGQAREPRPSGLPQLSTFLHPRQRSQLLRRIHCLLSRAAPDDALLHLFCTRDCLQEVARGGSLACRKCLALLGVGWRGGESLPSSTPFPSDKRGKTTPAARGESPR